MEDVLDRIRKQFDRFLSNPDNAELLPSDHQKRKQFLLMLRADLRSLRRTTAVIEFLSQMLEKVWEKATKWGA